MRRPAAKPSKARIADLNKTIGERMRQARLLCGMSQDSAASKLGYANSSRLSKMEHNPGEHGVSVWAVVRAARVYEVSTDYLLGLTDDFEGQTGALPDERGVSAWLHEALEESRRRDLGVMARLHERISTVSNILHRVAELADESASAVRRVQELNPQWEDMRSGSALERRIAELADTARHGKSRLERLRLVCQIDESAQGKKKSIFDLMEER